MGAVVYGVHISRHLQAQPQPTVALQSDPAVAEASAADLSARYGCIAYVTWYHVDAPAGERPRGEYATYRWGQRQPDGEGPPVEVHHAWAHGGVDRVGHRHTMPPPMKVTKVPPTTGKKAT